MLGAGRISTGNGQACGLPDGRRFIDSTEDKNLESAFSCLGNQGVDGSGREQPMEALSNALSDDFLGKDGCNQGFLRDDAILVVMVITDEEDDRPPGNDPFLQGSAGEPADWKKAVLAAKGNDEKAVIAIGLVGDTGTKDAVCKPFSDDMLSGAEESPRLREFFESFGSRGALGSVCAEDYAPFLAKLVADIDKNCEDFIPPV